MLKQVLSSFGKTLPEGSIGAGGLLESGGILVYVGSSRLTNFAELAIVILRLNRMIQDTAKGKINDRNQHGYIVGGSLSGGFTSDQTAPCFMAFMNDFGRVFLIFGFPRESESILRLAIGDFVDASWKKFQMEIMLLCDWTHTGTIH